MKKLINISVDNKPYSIEEGQSIMQALDSLGFHIPRLCYHPKLSIEGACRVCVSATILVRINVEEEILINQLTFEY